MEHLGRYTEFGKPYGVSIHDSVGKCPVELRAAVADYLDSGTALVVSGGGVDDVIDPTNTNIAGVGSLTDGERSWPISLGYYVRTYGVEVPSDILELARVGATAPTLTDVELAEAMAPSLKHLPGATS